MNSSEKDRSAVDSTNSGSAQESSAGASQAESLSTRMRGLARQVRQHWVTRFLEAAAAAVAVGTVIVSGITYLRSADDRARSTRYQAWQVINTAQGKPGSGGRVAALEQLLESGASLAGVDVSGSFLRKVRLPDAVLRRGNLSSAFLDSAVFTSADAAEVDFSRSYIELANFQDAFLFAADFRGTQLSRSRFRGADLRLAKLQPAVVRDAHGNPLEDRTSAWTQAVNVDFDSARLGGARFDTVDATLASFRSAKLVNATLRDGWFTLADFSNADLANTNLRAAESLAGANLAGVRNVPPADLRWALDSMNAVQIRDRRRWERFREEAAHGIAPVRVLGQIAMPRTHYRVYVNCAPIREIHPNYDERWCLDRAMDSIPKLYRDPAIPG